MTWIARGAEKSEKRSVKNGIAVLKDEREVQYVDHLQKDVAQESFLVTWCKFQKSS